MFDSQVVPMLPDMLRKRLGIPSDNGMMNEFGVTAPRSDADREQCKNGLHGHWKHSAWRSSSSSVSERMSINVKSAKRVSRDRWLRDR
jgi:hypothetical protein